MVVPSANFQLRWRPRPSANSDSSTPPRSTHHKATFLNGSPTPTTVVDQLLQRTSHMDTLLSKWASTSVTPYPRTRSTRNPSRSCTPTPHQRSILISDRVILSNLPKVSRRVTVTTVECGRRTRRCRCCRTCRSIRRIHGRCPNSGSLGRPSVNGASSRGDRRRDSGRWW
jgi:hypothetical protein